MPIVELTYRFAIVSPSNSTHGFRGEAGKITALIPTPTDEATQQITAWLEDAYLVNLIASGAASRVFGRARFYHRFAFSAAAFQKSRTNAGGTHEIVF